MPAIPVAVATSAVSTTSPMRAYILLDSIWWAKPPSEKQRIATTGVHVAERDCPPAFQPRRCKCVVAQVDDFTRGLPLAGAHKEVESRRHIQNDFVASWMLNAQGNS